MRKIISIMMVVGMLFGMTACGENSSFGKFEYSEVNNIPTLTANVDIAEKEKLSPADNLLLTDVAAQDKTYQNPILDTSYEHAGQFGDPYVMRWNGMYYLYPSPNGDYGIQCWISEDLVNWTFNGYCTIDDTFKGAWAPEVEYYNGMFYMVTTGYGGDGDYILTSDSPTGPFEIAASNLNTNFDSDIFIDDNGDWYMYFPSREDINAVTMSSTLVPDLWTFTPLGVTVAIDAWTEGPMVIKHKDTYFMTYCGGEVENPGYQIHYATSDGDLFNFVPGENNPILINTDITSYPGLGHSSIVAGPNLDSLYKVYHSMPWRSQPRTLMIDPLYINGNYMQAFGPTLSEQQAPEMPDIYSRFDSVESLTGWTTLNAEIVDSQLKLPAGGVVISEKGIEGDFTAEYNFLSIEDVFGSEEAFLPDYGNVGAIFDYKDANNYGAAYIDSEGSMLKVVFTVDGKETVYKEYLNASFDDQFDFSKLQKLTVKKYGSKYRFLFNDITVCEYESSLTGGAIGVSCVSGAAKIGFVGAEGNVWHSGYKEYYKPIKGEFGALLCVENVLNTVEYDGREYLSASAGETYNYYVNGAASGNYDLAIKYRSAETLSQFELYLNGELIGSGALPASNSDRTEVIRGLNIPQGYGVFTLKMTSGSADIFNYEFITSENITEPVTFDLSAPLYSEGAWSVENGKFNTDMQAKFLYGNREWTNYSVSATFESKGDYMDAHMLFRVTNESLSPKHSTTECRHYYIGYYVALMNNNGESYVALYKQNYGETELARFNMDIPLDRPVNVMVEAVDENILVYVDGQCVIEYSDPDPYLKGAVGFANIISAKVSDLKAEPLFS